MFISSLIFEHKLLKTVLHWTFKELAWDARINIPMGFRLQITCLSVRVGLCICGRHFDYYFKQKKRK